MNNNDNIALLLSQFFFLLECGGHPLRVALQVSRHENGRHDGSRHVISICVCVYSGGGDGGGQAAVAVVDSLNINCCGHLKLSADVV